MSINHNIAIVDAEDTRGSVELILNRNKVLCISLD